MRNSAFFGLLLTGLSACARGAPVRLAAGKSDSIVVNVQRPVKLQVEALDARGRVVRVSDMRYQRLSGDTLGLTADGHVTCVGRGDADVLVTAGALSRRFRLFCRPIKTLLFGGDLQLVTNGPPAAVPIEALGVDDKPAMPLAGTLTIQDSEIALLRGDLVYPKAPGATWVRIHIGDKTTVANVCVEKRVAHTSELRPYDRFVVSPLRLAGGEMRSWTLPPGGWYEIWLRADPGARGALVLAIGAANCAQARGGGQHYFCIADNGASVMVRNPRPPGQGPGVTGEFFVRRLLRESEAAPDARHGGAFPGPCRPWRP